MTELLSIKEASSWASKHLNKDVTPSNISYLIQYGRVPKIGENGSTYVNRFDLEKYYANNSLSKEEIWKGKFGDDLNWDLSFANYKESETTKHVHRLHPYKGKFIPQLVEYFLDNHTDKFKKEIFFKKDDIVLDPFCGSGTTLVQANELGINAIGVDISAFNTLISNVKIGKYDFNDIEVTYRYITKKLKEFQKERNNLAFESELLEELKIFNNENFPSPEFKYKISQKDFDEKRYGQEKGNEFLLIYERLLTKYKIELKQKENNTFLDKWFLQVIRDEVDFVFDQIKKIKNQQTKKILSIVLSRTIRSCRATTHSDLATLFEPQIKTYYCKKHGKICKPLFSILSWWDRYSKDTLKRINEFNRLRTETKQRCLRGDSRNINIFRELEKQSSDLANIAIKKK